MRMSDDVVIRATVEAMKEKLLENAHKEPLVNLKLTDALLRMQEEYQELADEFSTGDTLDYAAIRRELADICNFAGAAIVDCDRILFIQKSLK